MKIGLFTDTYHPDVNGVVISVDYSVNQFKKLGHEVYVVAPSIKGVLDDPKHVFRIPAIEVYSKYDIRASFPLPNKDVRNLLNIDFDIIHAHSCGTVGFFGYQLAKIRRVPYVFTYHTLFSEYVSHIFGGKLLTPKMVRWFSKFYCNLCDVVVAPSEKIETLLKKWEIEKPIHIVYTCVDLNRFTEGKTNYLFEKGYVLEEDVVLLYVGRLSKEKNVGFLIEAFAKVAKRVDRAKLVVVGNGTERENLEKVVLELGLSKRVVFTGIIPNSQLEKVYKSSHIFVMASLTEVHPRVVIEAVACGLPCVVVKDVSNQSIVVNGTNGFSVKHSLDKFSDACVKLCTDAPLRKRMGQNGRKLAEQKFSQTKQAKTLLTIYKALIG
ncbi:MAG: glycosyltransferase [Patescibacteria group bacterium]